MVNPVTPDEEKHPMGGVDAGTTGATLPGEPHRPVPAPCAPVQAEAAPAEAGPPAKKKRSADRQLTKDDFGDGSDDDDDGDGDGGNLKIGFKKASAEVLSKRKILKVRRPGAVSGGIAAAGAATPQEAGGNPSAATEQLPTGGTAAAAAPATAAAAAATTNEDSKPSGNPFANMVLVAKPATAAPGGAVNDGAIGTTGLATTATAAVPKVFGSGSAFAGFKTATAGGGGFAGFGTATSTTATPSGFGSSAASGFGKPSGFFAMATSSSPSSSPDKAAPPSEQAPLFQAAAPGAAGAFSFGFGSNVDAAGGDVEDGTGDAMATSSAAPTVMLPVNVELTTGEEDEVVVMEGRCKSFILVLVDGNVDVSETGDGLPLSPSLAKANPSVKPSKDFQTVVSTTKEGTPDEAQTTKESKEGRGAENNSGIDAAENGSKARDDPAKGAASSKPTVTDSAAAPAKQYRWQELGIGPVKILRSLSREGRYRVVQRRESTKNVILNAPLWKESSCTHSDISDKFSKRLYLALNTLVDGKVVTYSMRFKETADASEFNGNIGNSIRNARSAFPPLATVE